MLLRLIGFRLRETSWTECVPDMVTAISRHHFSSLLFFVMLSFCHRCVDVYAIIIAHMLKSTWHIICTRCMSLILQHLQCFVNISRTLWIPIYPLCQVYNLIH